MMVRFIFQTGVSRPDLLVSPHVLLAAETLAAGVAEVEVGHVASLVYLSVVRLRERPRAPTAIVGLANRPDLKWLVSYKSEKYFQRELLPSKIFSCCRFSSRTYRY